MIVSMVKINGTLRVLDTDLPRFGEYKKILGDGEIVEAEFRKPTTKKTRPQEKLFHALAKRYGSFLGYDQVYAKHELCIQFGTVLTMGQAIEDPPAWSGYAVEYHGVKYFRKSTTQYSVEEYAELINGTVHACIENGVHIEDIMREVA
jgi:hypothetical protein